MIRRRASATYMLQHCPEVHERYMPVSPHSVLSVGVGRGLCMAAWRVGNLWLRYLRLMVAIRVMQPGALACSQLRHKATSASDTSSKLPA